MQFSRLCPENSHTTEPAIDSLSLAQGLLPRDVKILQQLTKDRQVVHSGALSTALERLVDHF